MNERLKDTIYRSYREVLAYQPGERTKYGTLITDQLLETVADRFDDIISKDRGMRFLYKKGEEE